MQGNHSIPSCKTMVWIPSHRVCALSKYRRTLVLAAIFFMSTTFAPLSGNSWPTNLESTYEQYTTNPPSSERLALLRKRAEIHSGRVVPTVDTGLLCTPDIHGDCVEVDARWTRRLQARPRQVQQSYTQYSSSFSRPMVNGYYSNAYSDATTFSGTPYYGNSVNVAAPYYTTGSYVGNQNYRNTSGYTGNSVNYYSNNSSLPGRGSVRYSTPAATSGNSVPIPVHNNQYQVYSPRLNSAGPSASGTPYTLRSSVNNLTPPTNRPAAYQNPTSPTFPNNNVNVALPAAAPRTFSNVDSGSSIPSTGSNTETAYYIREADGSLSPVEPPPYDRMVPDSHFTELYLTNKPIQLSDLVRATRCEIRSH